MKTSVSRSSGWEKDIIIAAKRPAKKVCSGCGRKNPSGAMKCRKCGMDWLEGM